MKKIVFMLVALASLLHCTTPKEIADWRKLANDGNKIAQYNLGLIYIDGLGGVTKDYNQAFKWFKLAADQGDVNAQYNIGELYENSKYTKQNQSEAIKWYKLAAKQGNTDAKEALKRLQTSK